MTNNQNKLEEVSLRLQALEHNQQLLNVEIEQLRTELLQLKLEAGFKTQPVQQSLKPANTAQPNNISSEPIAPPPVVAPAWSQTAREKLLNNQKLEDFIGTNLISKIGILITIIGIFIGAKYAIDKELISPAMRIVTGYVAASALVLVALKLKVKYENFSAVLMGGGLAVFYFITYVSYSFYQLFPQTLAFLLMVVITGAAVSIALWYNQKVIAILGQVAAYAIPFLLSDGSGRVVVLFSYVSLINIGLLILSFIKNWKELYRIAFVLTWVIYTSWIVVTDRRDQEFSTSIIFLSINFLTFYATFLSYKVLRKELYNLGEVTVLLVNSLVFFFLGAGLINDYFPEGHALTYFTIANAIVHLLVGLLLYKRRLADVSVYQFLFGLGLLFVTIAIPIELDGNWVTLLWTIEAVVVSWIAFKNNRSLYLTIAAPLIIIACVSLLHDWFLVYLHYNDDTIVQKQILSMRPFIHLTFWFSLLVSGCLGYITDEYIRRQPIAGELVTLFFKTALPAIFLTVLYFTFTNEINHAFNYTIHKTAARSYHKDQLQYLAELTRIVFTIAYLAMLLEYTRRYVKSQTPIPLLLTLSILVVAVFLFRGLYLIGQLRDIYLFLQARNAPVSLSHLLMRYISFISLALLFLAGWHAIKKLDNRNRVAKGFTFVLNIALLTIICNEFIHWMDIAGFQNQYKLGLSIIWALYALVLVFVGITYQRKQLRLAAIILFALTLLKLFFYDLSALTTVSKTIVLVILGIILLVVSFLYNKYKHVILGEDESS